MQFSETARFPQRYTSSQIIPRICGMPEGKVIGVLRTSACVTYERSLVGFHMMYMQTLIPSVRTTLSFKCFFFYFLCHNNRVVPNLRSRPLSRGHENLSE
jgi:hypothetical protein